MKEGQSKLRPKTFFLNEQHELVHGEKDGGGRTPQYVQIDWTEKGRRISHSLRTVKSDLAKTPDPLREKRYFVLAKPQKRLFKKSISKQAVDGRLEQETSFAKTDSQIFRKLGIDLVRVNGDGSATVHATPEGMAQLGSTSEGLSHAKTSEKARWAAIDSFGIVPWNLKLDKSWLDTLKPEPADAVIELQPLLSRVEIDQVIRAVGERLRRAVGEGFRTTGTDFSGRQWYRGRILPTSMQEISSAFFSVQAIHPPLVSHVMNPQREERARPIVVQSGEQPNPTQLPTVAVVDTGVPADHPTLGKYRRAQFAAENAANSPLGDHGSRVASRVVFGDPDYEAYAEGKLVGSCQFLDVLAAQDADHIESKSVVPALRGVVGFAPDVRVFNLSFDHSEPWTTIPDVKRQEYMALVQDLDNFVFANDVLVVVAAGNSPPGLIPNPQYPNHYEQPEWRLGPWARSFNGLTCGSHVDRLDPHGLAKSIGWPSPFSKLGPGIAESPKPDFSAHGGNGNAAYRWEAGLGVWAFNADGMFEDLSGTSYAAPLLAREAAILFSVLQPVCSPGNRPFASTVKAFLALTAQRTANDKNIDPLMKVASRFGKANSSRLQRPSPNSAVFLWQGVLNDSDDIARVQIPIPLAWIKASEKPTLRLVLSWDTPASAAVFDTWGCRKVEAQLRPSQEAEAVLGSHSHRSYPLSVKHYDLKKAPVASVVGDSWLLELSYRQVAEYAAGLEFSPIQRVSFAAELVDFGETRVSPQAAVQGLEVSTTLTRLGAQQVTARSPILVKTRV